MKIHTSNFKNEIKTLGKQQTVRITYTLNDEIKIIDSEDINSATPNYEGNLLKSVMKVLDLDSNIDIPKDTEIKFEYGLLVDGSYEYLNYGNYIVYSSEKQEDTLSYNIKCYDKLLYSMKDYEELDIVYPKTIKQYLIALCTKIGLEFKDSTFANQDRIVSSDLFKGLDYTYRDVLDQIAETTGGCICLTTDDKVEVRYTNKLVEYEEKNKIKESTFDSEINENLVVDKVYGSTSQETREELKSVLTGSEIVVNDTYIDNKTQFIIDGNSEQNAYEGYNLCYIPNQTINGVTIINSNNGLILNGTCSSTFSIVALEQKVEAGDYIIKNLGDGASNTTYQNVIYKNNNIAAYVTKTNKSITFENDDEIRLKLYIYSGTIFNNLILPVQVCKDNDRPYEPYTGGIASPNPDYPQEIETVGGINKFDIKELVKLSDDYSEVENGYTFNFNMDMYNTGVALTVPIELPASISYTIKNGTGTNFRLKFWFDNDTVMSLNDYKSGTDTEEHDFVINNFTKSRASKITRIGFDRNNKGTFTLTNFMINEGATVKPYLPYSSIGIEQSGINKLGLTNGTLKSGSGITVKELENGGISITGTASSDTNFVYIWKLKNIVKNNQLITISNGITGITGLQVSLRDASQNIISESWTNNAAVKSATLTTDAYYYQIQINSNITVNTTIYPMIVEGTYSETTLPAYEPYHEPKIIPIDLQGNTLAKVGNVKDILKVNRNGEVKIEKNIWEETINSSDLITLSNNNKGLVFTPSKKKITSMSDNDYLVTNAQRNRTFNDGTVYQNPANFVFVGSPTDTLETIKAKFNGGKILYQLATPQTITLPSISPIELEQGTNIFKLISNLDTTMELTYNYISTMPSTETPSKINNTESINIKIQNESLFDIKELVKMSDNYSEVENGYIFSSKYDMYSDGVILATPITLPASLSYTVKNGTGTNFRFIFVYDDGSATSFTKYLSGTEADVTKNIVINNITKSGASKIVKICIDYSHAGTFTITNFMINEGTTAKPYIKHKEQNISFNLDKPLYQNCYLAEDGIHYKKIQIELDGTTDGLKVTNVTKHSNDIYYCVVPTAKKGINGVNNLYCSHFKAAFGVEIGQCYVTGAGSGIVFILNDQTITTPKAANDWLAEQKEAGNPVTIEYELATEEIVPYTENRKRSWKNLQKLISYTGKNYVESTADIDIKFPINRDTVDEEYINDTNVNFGEKYGPINSIVLARAGEADKIYIKNQESIEENGLCELMISENQFMNFNDRSDYLQELSDELFGVEYYLNDFVSTGIMYYDLLDMYNIKIDDNKYKCLMLNDEQCITQGLEENIHTDMPEKSETDYTKADKTDRRINQTYLIVDKQNQQIEGIVNQIGDRTDKTTTITADIDGLTSKVSTIADLTNDINGTKSVSLEKCVAGEIVEFHISGNNSVFKYQYLDDSLYLNDNLILGKDKSIIIITDENGNKTYNDLGIEEVLRQNGSVYDEYILKDGQAQIIRRINKDGTIKDNEEIEDLGEFHIPLSKGNNTLEIKDFSANIYVKWAVQNEYTDIFATKAEMNSNIKQTSQEINLSVDKKFENYSTTTEMNSTITQTAESINSEVRKKVGEDEIISKINQSAEAVSIDAQKININGAISANGNFQVDTDGNMICNNGQFNGGKVTLLDNPEDDDSRLEITSSGAETKIFSDGLYINNSSGSASLRIRIACS